MARKKTVTVIVLLLGLLASGIAWARGGAQGGIGFQGHFHGQHHHGHFHNRATVGVVLGAPLIWPGYYRSPPYYVQPSPIILPPPVYIEQPSTYWYYCSNPQGYYPYVKECPGGSWQPVPPQPPR